MNLTLVKLGYSEFVRGLVPQGDLRDWFLHGRVRAAVEQDPRYWVMWSSAEIPAHLAGELNERRKRGVENYLKSQGAIALFRPLPELEETIVAIRDMSEESRAALMEGRHVPKETWVKTWGMNWMDPKRAVEAWYVWKAQPRPPARGKRIKRFGEAALYACASVDEAIRLGHQAENCLRGFLRSPLYKKRSRRLWAYEQAIEKGFFQYLEDGHENVKAILFLTEWSGRQYLTEANGPGNRGIERRYALLLRDYCRANGIIAYDPCASIGPGRYIGLVEHSQRRYRLWRFLRPYRAAILQVPYETKLPELMKSATVDLSGLPVTDEEVEGNLGKGRYKIFDISRCSNLTRLPSRLRADRIILDRDVGGRYVDVCSVKEANDWLALPHAKRPKPRPKIPPIPRIFLEGAMKVLGPRVS